MAKRLTKVEKILSYPVKLSDPVIAVINYLIFRYTADINTQNAFLRRTIRKPESDRGLLDIRNPEDFLTFDENRENHGGTYHTPDLNLISNTAKHISFLETQINQLTTLKLAMIGDVDFSHGQGYVDDINKMYADGLARLDTIKRRDRERTARDARRRRLKAKEKV